MLKFTANHGTELLTMSGSKEELTMELSSAVYRICYNLLESTRQEERAALIASLNCVMTNSVKRANEEVELHEKEDG